MWVYTNSFFILCNAHIKIMQLKQKSPKEKKIISAPWIFLINSLAIFQCLIIVPSFVVLVSKGHEHVLINCRSNIRLYVGGGRGGQRRGRGIHPLITPGEAAAIVEDSSNQLLILLLLLLRHLLQVVLPRIGLQREHDSGDRGLNPRQQLLIHRSQKFQFARLHVPVSVQIRAYTYIHSRTRRLSLFRKSCWILTFLAKA
nr:hypothetical protein Iba_chr12bCG11950 [Ipomoea batatas]